MKRRKISSDKNVTDGHILFKKQCKYIGSVAVTSLNGEECQRFVNEKLLEMKDVGKGVSIVLMITDEGVKILKENESIVKMAHGITRIAFSSCQPERKLFAYVAKSLSVNKTIIIQAHMFKTKKNSHSQQLSSYLSKAFKVAYTRDSTRRKNRVKLFESEADEQKVSSAIQNRGKRWAKVEMAHGHDYSGHALNARNNLGSSHINNLMKDLEMNEADSNQIVDGRSSCNSSSSTDIEKESLEAKRLLSDEKHWSSGDDVLHLADSKVSCNNNNINIVTAAARFVDGNASAAPWDGYQNIVLNKDEYIISDEVFQAEEVEANNIDTGLTIIPSSLKSSGEDNPQRIRMDTSRFTMTEEELLKDSEWFQPGFSREIAETVLQNRSCGSFFIRDSLSHPNNYVMSVRVPPHMKTNGIGHFLLERVEDNFLRIKGFSMQFSSLSDLVAHYGTVQDDIPVQLRLCNDNPLFLRRSYIDQPDNVNAVNDHVEVFDEDDEYEDPDYENFTSNDDIMNELHLLNDKNTFS